MPCTDKSFSNVQPTVQMNWFRVNGWVSEWVSERVSEWVNEWMSEWVNEWVREWVSERMSEWVSEWVSEWMNDWESEWVSEWESERVSEWVNEWVSEWESEWVSEWMSEWVNEWVNELVFWAQSTTRDFIRAEADQRRIGGTAVECGKDTRFTGQSPPTRQGVRKEKQNKTNKQKNKMKYRLPGWLTPERLQPIRRQ